MGEPQRYRIYVLRLRLSEELPPQWQISLEDIRSRQRTAFATMVEFVRYLQALTGTTAPDQGSPPTPPL